jgi:small subunit ribosomal protein S20
MAEAGSEHNIMNWVKLSLWWIEPLPQLRHSDLGNLRRWGIAKRVVWPGEARATRFLLPRFHGDCYTPGSYAVSMTAWPLVCLGHRGRRKNQFMANTKSAIKRIRTSEQRRQRNVAVKSATRTFVKKARTAIAQNAEDTQASIVAAVSALDKAAKKGVVHPNNAARRKSRLMKRFNAANAAREAEAAAAAAKAASSEEAAPAPAKRTRKRSS